MKKHGNRSPEAIQMQREILRGWRRTAGGKIRGFVLSIISLLVLVSCGGGVDDLASGGIGGTGTISIGTISALGSIFVNGVEFDTAGASVDFNGSSGDAGMLQVGMVVTVQGVINNDDQTGVATSVGYDDNLQGPVSAVVPENGSLTVLSHQIFTDDATVFNTGLPDPGLADLINGDIIEVSGLANADGSIQATRITLLPPDADREFQITGPVSGVLWNSFQINDLTVDYSQAAQGVGPMNRPQNGAVVEAKGYLDGNDILIATELRMMGNYSQENCRMQLTGYIQSATADTFTISAPMGAISVVIDQDTAFTGGTAADLAPGVLVQVEGGMSMGTLTASGISIIN
jgi:hypothetical protein